MSEKKNIDRLFQEKLKDFEQKPSPDVWNAIQKELQNEVASSRPIPMWIKLSSVAAILLLFFWTGAVLLNTNNTTPVNTIVDTQNNPSENATTAPNNTDVKNINSSTQNNNNNITDEYGNASQAANTKKKNTILNNENVAHTRLDDDAKTHNSSKTLNSETVASALSDESNRNSLSETENRKKFGVSFKEQNGLLESNSAFTAEKNEEFFESSAVNQKKSKLIEAITTQYETELATTQNKETLTGAKSQLNNIPSGVNAVSEAGARNKITSSFKPAEDTLSETFNTLTDSESKLTNDATLANTDLKPQTTEDYAEGSKNSTLVTQDSLKIVTDDNPHAVANVVHDSIAKQIAENAIEKAVALLEDTDTNEIEQDSAPSKRWSIAPSIAPVYYNTLSKGSPIDPQFSSNKKRGGVNLSMGVLVGYQVTDKLSVRSGINKFDVGYKTDNVVVRPSVSSSNNGTLKNVTLRDGATNLAIFGESSFNVNELPSDLALRFDAFLDQRISYYELPMEMSYRLSDKKLGINIIGGISTLILNENELYAQQPSGTRILLGEANNLNSVSFSTNVGVGFHYKISKSFNFNLEPVFKYQLNSFNENSGGFKPYTMGVYSGLSYKF